jgi:hypothetical protein
MNKLPVLALVLFLLLPRTTYLHLPGATLPVVDVGLVSVPGGYTIAVPDNTVGRFVFYDNIILVGHNPGVFTPLLELGFGDWLVLDDKIYVVTDIHLVLDEGQSDAVRRRNAEILYQTGERLTLITCIDDWRLIIIAEPKETT